MLLVVQLLSIIPCILYVLIHSLNETFNHYVFSITLITMSQLTSALNIQQHTNQLLLTAKDKAAEPSLELDLTIEADTDNSSLSTK